jgi:hypothetical protein
LIKKKKEKIMSLWGQYSSQAFNFEGGAEMLHPLKLKRLEKGLSQHALSFKSGVAQVRICYFEKGYPSLRDKDKRAIAAVLQCPREDLFGADAVLENANNKK